MRRLAQAVADGKTVAIFHNGKFDHEFLEFPGEEPMGTWTSPTHWEDTLLICASEFGRTPEIGSNQAGGWGGRAHYGRNFAMMLGGGPIQGGQVVGATNKDGTAIIDRQVNVADMHRTYYTALGMNPDAEFEVDGQPIPIQEEGEQIVKELLV